jgi:hypothetical protein
VVVTALEDGSPDLFQDPVPSEYLRVRAALLGLLEWLGLFACLLVRLFDLFGLLGLLHCWVCSSGRAGSLVWLACVACLLGSWPIWLVGLACVACWLG